jgi:EAL domain
MADAIAGSQRREDSTFDGLMREADVAMYAAMAKGKNRVEQYDAGLDDLALARLALKADVGDAAGRGELVLDYQPIVDLDTGLLVGLEALVRWQHPTRGLLPPSPFIEVAEETGAIIDIGAFVLETAANQIQRWQRRYGLPALSMSVNVSVRRSPPTRSTPCWPCRCRCRTSDSSHPSALLNSRRPTRHRPIARNAWRAPNGPNAQHGSELRCTDKTRHDTTRHDQCGSSRLRGRGPTPPGQECGARLRP